MEATTDTTKSQTRKGRKPSAARVDGASREWMKPHEVTITPLHEQGGRLTRIEQTLQGNGVRLFLMKYVGPVQVDSHRPITLLEAWIAASGLSPRQLAYRYDLSPNTIRAQTFCPQVFKLLAHETGINALVLASHKAQATWVLRFDEEGKVTGSEAELLTEDTLQRIAREKGFVLPPKR